MLHESHEDYWEDASVSLGCNHDWDFAFSTPFQTQEEAHTNKKAVNAPKACQINEYAAASSAKRLRSFPPPMSTFCVTLSIKEGGRFVLKETEAFPPLHNCFRAERTDGRLCLRLVEPEQLDEDSCNESELGGGVQDRYMPAHEDNIATPDRYNDKLVKDDIVANIKDMCGSNVCHPDAKIEVEGELISAMAEDGTDDIHVVDDGREERENDVYAAYAASSLNSDAHSDGIHYSTSANYEVKQEALKSRSNEEASIDPMGEVLLPIERGPLWSVNDMAARIQPWSPNELLRRSSLANMSPSLGLTVS